MHTFIRHFLKRDILSDVTYADFEAFIRQGIEEHQNLEYKPRGLLVKKDGTVITPHEPNEVQGYMALAKSVASFANSEGGLLVLGVREKPERYKGLIVKVKPGAITPLPLSVTREAIENNLTSKIQYPIEGMTIVPLRRSPRSKEYVYLIDVPQSHRAPHRVNERYYFQRLNFTTYEMKHYQVADLFGRRFAPDLTIGTAPRKGNNEENGHFTLETTIANRGRAAAKFVTCICQIIEGPYKVINTDWKRHPDKMSCQFQTMSHNVVYPDVPTNAGYIEFGPENKEHRPPLVLRFSIYAEDMTGRSFNIQVDPNAV